VKLEDEIGLSRGAIFNYFPSKEDLFVELAARDNARISEIWINDGLDAVIRAVVELDPAWLSVVLELFRRTRTDPEFKERFEARHEHWRPRTGRVWKRPSGQASSATISTRSRSGRSSTSC
jgi:TetR/AcrR family transcriptional regulator, transcriptional repressor of aconitase